MSAETNKLPEFDNPPIIESAIGVEFAPIEGWSVLHFGLFWGMIREEFPQFEIQPPLASRIEGFCRETQRQTPTVELATNPDIRCWFVDQEHRLVQIQNSRLIYNWRKASADAVYPHYSDSVRPGFESAWRNFVDFLASEKLPAPEVKQCEVTYVNHLDVGKGWASLDELSNVVALWRDRTDRAFLPELESVGLNVSYAMPERQGRLRINLVPVVRHEDGQEALQLTLTARGRPKTSATLDILGWLDIGREWVVRGFTEFTSETMHSIWKRTS
jgi:uncharacterized protein (TIGR04255 family)